MVGHLACRQQKRPVRGRWPSGPKICCRYQWQVPWAGPACDRSRRFRMLHVDIGTDALPKVQLIKGIVLQERDYARICPTRAIVFQEGRPRLELTPSDWPGA